MQKLQAAADRNRTYSAVVLLDTKQFRQLSDDTITVSQPPAAGDWAVGSRRPEVPPRDRLRPAAASDYAARERPHRREEAAAERLRRVHDADPSLSPTGKYLARVRRQGLVHDLRARRQEDEPDRRSSKVKFFNEEDDHPGDAAAVRPAAVDRATASSSSSTTATTSGSSRPTAPSPRTSRRSAARSRSASRSCRRAARTTATPTDRGIDLSKPLLLGAENLHTRDTGFYRLEPGGDPKLLIMGARRYGLPTKAKNADVYLLTVQTFYDSTRTTTSPTPGLPRAEARDGHQPEGEGVQLGQGRAGPLHEHRRRAAVGRAR